MQLQEAIDSWLVDEYDNPRADQRIAFGTPRYVVEVARDLVVYEVARNQGLPDDTSATHPKVYRRDIVDVRNANARHIAAANPAAVLALLDRIAELEQR